jgi:CheY-like chemotaxis protein
MDGRKRKRTVADAAGFEREGLRILLVEDNRVHELEIVRILEEACCRVLVARTGSEALLLLRYGAVQAVLLDISLPEVSGLELAAAVRDSERCGGRPRTPILALSPGPLKADRAARERADFDGVVAKPICARELLEALRKVCAKSLAR